MKKLLALILTLLMLCSCAVAEEQVVEEPQNEEKIEEQTEPSVQKRYYRIYSGGRCLGWLRLWRIFDSGIQSHAGACVPGSVPGGAATGG